MKSLLFNEPENKGITLKLNVTQEDKTTTGLRDEDSSICIYISCMLPIMTHVMF